MNNSQNYNIFSEFGVMECVENDEKQLVVDNKGEFGVWGRLNGGERINLTGLTCRCMLR